ncbi:MAG: hypothetical protein ACE3L7_22270 [Candidatus Pristimantibacillus sp.]
MEQIYPLNEEVIQQFCGMPVCAIMQDGSRHVGILSYCRNGRIMLNDEGKGPEAEMLKTETKPKKNKAGKKGKGKLEKEPAVQTQAYPYDPYYYNPNLPFGGALALDLAPVAYLFLIT